MQNLDVPDIVYNLEPDLSVQEFYEILQTSTLAERRPVDDGARLAVMLKEADIILTARDGTKIVGISRAITDYSYCCYLSDLAVDKAYQGQGIGKKLLEKTHDAASHKTSLILLSAPTARSYYPKVGMETIQNGWIMPRKN